MSDAMEGPAGYARVLRLLDLERKLLLTGPLDGLEAAVAEREAALDALLETETDLPAAFLVALKARAERNSRLILASLGGVRAGVALAEEAQAAGRLRVYSEAGARLDVAAPPQRDQRA